MYEPELVHDIIYPDNQEEWDEDDEDSNGEDSGSSFQYT